MTLSPQQRSEFEDLLHALCEDMLDDAGEARLSELLAGHEDARTLYIEALAMHADLAWDLRERGRVSIPASSLADSDETGTPVSTPVRVPRKAVPSLDSSATSCRATSICPDRRQPFGRSSPCSSALSP